MLRELTSGSFAYRLLDFSPQTTRSALREGGWVKQVSTPSPLINDHLLSQGPPDGPDLRQEFWNLVEAGTLCGGPLPWLGHIELIRPFRWVPAEIKHRIIHWSRTWRLVGLWRLKYEESWAFITEQWAGAMIWTKKSQRSTVLCVPLGCRELMDQWRHQILHLSAVSPTHVSGFKNRMILWNLEKLAYLAATTERWMPREHWTGAMI